MKKIYVIPAVEIVAIATQGLLLSNSLQISNTQSNEDAWTKEDRSEWSDIWDDWDD